jgi:hypothetical protein
VSLPPTSGPTHEVRLVDGRFTSAACSCGWQSAARRTRSTVRAEARDHALLYAGSRDESLVVELVGEVTIVEPRAEADPRVDAGA